MGQYLPINQRILHSGLKEPALLTTRKASQLPGLPALSLGPTQGWSWPQAALATGCRAWEPEAESSSTGPFPHLALVRSPPLPPARLPETPPRSKERGDYRLAATHGVAVLSVGS